MFNNKRKMNRRIINRHITDECKEYICNEVLNNPIRNIKKLINCVYEKIFINTYKTVQYNKRPIGILKK